MDALQRYGVWAVVAREACYSGVRAMCGIRVPIAGSAKCTEPSLVVAAPRSTSTPAPTAPSLASSWSSRRVWRGFGSMPIAHVRQRSDPKTSVKSGSTCAPSNLCGSKSLRICTPILVPKSRYTPVQLCRASRLAIGARRAAPCHHTTNFDLEGGQKFVV